MTDEGPLLVCRVCGCTDGSPCMWVEDLGGGAGEQKMCSWVEPGLCSECAPPDETPTPLLFDAHGAPLVFR